MSVHHSRTILLNAECSLAAGQACFEASRGALQSTGSNIGAALCSRSSNMTSLRCSRLTTSLQPQSSLVRMHSSGREAQELQAILQGNHNGTPVTTPLFGVSPPVRNGWAGGAANPFGHEAAWNRNAHLASHNNLEAQRQALRELEATGLSFLKGDVLVDSPPDCGTSMPQALEGRQKTDNSLPGDFWPRTTGGTSPFQCHVRYFAI